MSFKIKPIEAADKEWIIDLTRKWWAGPDVITKGIVHHTGELPGFIAVQGEKRVGLATYKITGQECEIVTMNSLIERKGVGAALINAVKNAAVLKGCKRLWLLTTNDNTHALKFYQKNGMVISAVNINAMAKERLIKPEIPLTGNDGIPLRDEIELEMAL